MVEEVRFILFFMANAVKNLSVFFFIGIGLATLIKTQGYDKKLHHLIANKKGASIPVAVGAGSFSPLCSCGVIPAIAALLTAGVPLAPIMAFWITSPLMDPESFVITFGLLGRDMAFARLFATLAIGLVAGYTTLYLSNKGHLNNQILKMQSCDCSAVSTDQPLQIGRFKKASKLRNFIKEYSTLAVFVGKFILLAFFLEALIVRYVPMDWVPSVLGMNNPFGPILAAFLGIPAYASTYASMPIVRSMIDLGMDKGTALAFMIAGAATSLPAMVAVYALVKKKTFALYVAFSLVGAIVSGYAFRLFLG